VLLRDARLRPVMDKPLESDCVHISSQMISESSGALGELLGKASSGVSWNVDELGHADWPGAHPEATHRPIEFEPDSVRILVSRTGERITLTGCIYVDGTFLKPLLIVS
jgi:hypothetical protein